MIKIRRELLLMDIGFIVCFYLSCTALHAQVHNANAAEYTMGSPNPLMAPYYERSMMPMVDFSKYFNKIDNTEGRSGGIVAFNFSAGGRVDLSMHLYDETETDGKGALLYSCFSTSNSSTENDYKALSNIAAIPFILKTPNQPTQIIMKDVPSTDAVALAQAAMINQTAECKSAVTQQMKNYAQSGAVSESYWQRCKSGYSDMATNANTPVFNVFAGGVGCLLRLFGVGVHDNDILTPIDDVSDKCLQKLSSRQPVIITVRVNNATVKKIKLPGIGVINTDDFFACNVNDLVLKVFINGNQAANNYINFPQPNDQIPTINLTMGDDVTFEVQMDLSSSVKPQIYGIPDVWVANFAGDVMYHCNPNIQPGEITPFIGFDSRVHTLMLRPYPQSFIKRVSDWEELSSADKKTYRWTWTASREMNAEKTIYNQTFNWPKAHINPKNGALTIQRQNQKEGLNMQYLSYFDAGIFSDFYNYQGRTKYMLGFDDDELGYFNHPFAQVQDPGPMRRDETLPNFRGVVKLENLLWKDMEFDGNELTYNTKTGYPESGFPVNIMVDAYRRFQSRKIALDNNIPIQNYHGYEIQDEGTSPEHPNGVGSNNTHPGLITIKVGSCHEIKLKLNVVSPLDHENGRSLGFYEAIQGTDYPSYGEQNAAYWLKGVENKPSSEVSKYTIEYNTMDRLGVIRSQTVNVTDIINEKHGQSWINWANSALRRIGFNIGGWGNPIDFDAGRPAYAWINAYYQRTPASKKVIVAGKELTNIFLMFCGVKEYNEKPFKQDKGHGSKIFLEDIRNQPSGNFNSRRDYGSPQNPRHRYVNKYTNQYVIPINTTLKFTTFDGDPYRFDNNEEEWYLSNRSMAKRVKDSLLDGSGIHGNTAPNADDAYLKYYLSVSAQGASSEVLMQNGRSGKDMVHTFTIEGAYDLHVKYRNSSDLYNKITVVDYPNGQKGRILQRSISQQEAQWLGIQNSEIRDYQIFEVVDVYSKFLWEDGLRNPKVPGGKPNRWAPNNDYLDAYTWENAGNTIATASTLMENLNTNFQKSSDRWFWKDWALHYSSNWLRPVDQNKNQGLPIYVPENALTRIYKPEDLNPFNEYIRTNIFGNVNYSNQLRTPWQFVIPLISYTDYHGYRFRTNPSCIYDLNKVFDINNGAFTGNPPNPPDPESIQAPDISDEDKDLQAFYYNVKYGRIIIKNNPSFGTELRVYQYNPEPANHKGEFISNTIIKPPPMK